MVAALSFSSGARGTIVATTAASPGFPHRVEVYGSRGGAQIEGDALVRWEGDARPGSAPRHLRRHLPRWPRDRGPVPLASAPSGTSSSCRISSPRSARVATRWWTESRVADPWRWSSPSTRPPASAARIEGLPQKLSEVPRNPSEVLEKSFGVPQKFSEVPQKLFEVPRNRSEVLEKSFGVPQKFSEVPQKLFEVPRHRSEVLEKSFGVLQKFSEVPQKLFEVSRHRSEVLEKSFEVPQKFSEVPQKLFEVLRNRSEVPQKRSEVPEKTSEVLQNSSEVL